MSIKVLHGMSEVAGQGIYTVKGLQQNGVDANMAVWSRNPSNYPVDIDLKINKNRKYMYPLYTLKMGVFALGAFKKYDIFHSHYGYSLIPFNLDVILFKLLDKKLFTEFHGSDLRFIFQDVDYKFYNPDPPEKQIRKKLQKRLKRLLKFSSGIILHDEELREHLPDVNIPVYIVPLRINMEKFVPVYPDENVKKPIIVHAPSKRSTKGTEEILSALKNVSGDYELILVEGKTQDEAIEIYRKADIIVDQISVGTYGVFAIEAMALGKPVITYISEKMRETFPNELPIVSSEFDSLPNVIDELISSGKLRRELGIKGRKYAERFHDNGKVTKYLADIYNGTVNDNNLFNIL